MAKGAHATAFVFVLTLILFSRPDSRGELLVSGTTIRIRPAASRTYRLYLNGATHSQLRIVQHDADIAVAYLRREDAEWKVIDAYEYGEESASIDVETGQTVAVEIRVKAVTSNDAYYAVTTNEPRRANPLDDLRAKGERLATEVKRSFNHLPEDPQEILEKSKQATAIWRHVNVPALEAAGLVATANILFAKGRMREALDFYMSASAISAHNHDWPNLAEALNDAGYVELLLGNVRASEGHLAEALRVWTNIGSKYGRLTALNNSGLLEWQSGEFAMARKQYQQALELADPQDRRSRGILLNNLGLIYRALGDYPRAIGYLSDSLDLLPKTDATATAKTMINLGRAYLMSGDVASSIEWLGKALLLARQSPNPHTVADVLNTLAQANNENGQFAGAESELTEAFNIFDTAGDRRGRASAQHNLGLVRAAQHRFPESLRLLHESLRFRLSAGLRDDAADSLFELARVLRSTGERAEARSYSAHALKMIESLRGGIPGEHFRITYSSRKQSFYEFYIGLLMEMHRASPRAGFDREAFSVAEHAQGRAMLEILSEAKADIKQGIDNELLSRELLARKTLGFVSGEITRLEESSHTAERHRELLKEQKRAVEEYENVETEIRDRSRQYASLVWPKPRSLAGIQRKALDADTALLEYSLGEDHSYLWLVTQNSFMSFELPSKRQLLPLCREMRVEAGAYRERLKDHNRQSLFKLTADSLAGILLGPMANRLTKKKLVIVTPGPLQEVPFAALRAPGPRDNELAPLGATNEIVRMTSSSAYLEMRERNRRAQRRPLGVAVFADPVFGASDSRLPRDKRQSAASAGASLARLPFTAQEAEEILRLFPQETSLRALGFDASRENLLRSDLGRYRYIHFATHAFVEEVPELSAIALSGVSREGKRVDGLIRLPDVYNLPPLSADLVVLAGCDTGAGQDVPGEGLIGLTRGFLYSGARSVLINLWTLEDGPRTLEAMKSIYSGLSTGKSPAAALRAARESLWHRGGQWRDEYYLSGLEIYGETE